MAEFVMTCPDCNAPLIVNTWFFSKRKVKCECGKVVVATKIAEESCPECGNKIVYNRSTTHYPQCQTCKHIIDVRARNMKAINDHANRSFLTVDLTEIYKKKDEVAYFEEDGMLASIADDRVAFALNRDEEEAHMSFFSIYAGLPDKLGEGTDHYNYILNALYRYCKEHPNEDNENFFQRVINFAASLLSDNEALETIKKDAEFLTPELGAEIFFNMIISELYYENGEVSPFRSLELKKAVEYYINTVGENSVLSQNNELVEKIIDYTTILKERYEMPLDATIGGRDNS